MVEKTYLEIQILLKCEIDFEICSAKLQNEITLQESDINWCQLTLKYIIIIESNLKLYDTV